MSKRLLPLIPAGLTVVQVLPSGIPSFSTTRFASRFEGL